MPTPQDLQDAITSGSGDFTPSTEHKLYEDYKASWQLCLDMLELDAVKLAAMVEGHEGEGAAKLAMRKKLSAVFNLIPSIVGMIRDYLFAEEPQIDVKNDEHLKAFVDNCNGRGLRFVDFIKHKALPLSLALGMVDVLVQNPMLDEGEEPATQKDAAEKSLRPVVFPITAVQRINWSVRPDGSYHWVCFRDADIEDDNPLKRNVAPTTAYITVSAANTDVVPGADTGFWIRSWKEAADGGGASWQHKANFTPTARVPVATLYYQESLDPMRPHWPVSKIAMMVILTKLMIQVLSWTTEDMLANLALLALPSKDGQPPKDDKGAALQVTVSASTILWYDKESKNEPIWVQGSVDHIKVKMEFVSAIVAEILRLARLIGASAEAEKITSGVQGFVARNELFQELSTLAGGLDTFAFEVMALVKSWATDEDWDVARIRDLGVVIDFYKGPYTIEPLSNLIQNAERLVRLFSNGGISPTAVQAVYEMVARSTFYAADPKLKTIVKEIGEKVGEVVANDATAAEVAAEVQDAKKPGSPFDLPVVKNSETLATGGVA